MAEVLREFSKINMEELDRSLPEEYDDEITRLDNGKLYSPLLDNFYDKDKIMMQGYNLLNIDQINTKLTLKERRYYVNYLLKIFQEIESNNRLDFVYDYIQLIGSPEPKNLYEQLEEYQLSKKYPKYFIQNYIKLDLPGKRVNFILNTTQHAYVDALWNDHYVRVLKSRQIGISTIQQAILAHNLTFYSGLEQGVISKDQTEASNFQQVTKKMMRTLPEWLFPEFSLDNVLTQYTKKTDNYLRTGTVKVDEPNKLFRGRPLTLLVIDEQAFIKKLDEALTGIEPAVSRAQQNAKRRNIPYYTTEISTPNGTFGTGKVYYDHIMESLRGDTVHKLLQLHWSQVPEFQDDPEWYETQKKKYKNNPRLLNQEYELKFLGSQSAIFDDNVIEKLQTHCKFTNIKEAYNFYFKRRNYQLDEMEVKKQKLHPELVDGEFNDEQYIDLQDNQLYIFKKPEKGHKYVYGIDVATQTGADNSVIVIMDYHTREVVAMFLGKLSMKNFTQQIEWILTNLFTTAKIFPENNGVGKGLQEELEKSKIIYPSLYHTVRYNKDGTKITSKKVGINNNSTLRPILMDLVYEFVNDNYDKLYSKLLSMQLIALERDKSGKIIGDKDDIVLQFSFALYALDYNLFNKRDSFQTVYNEKDLNVVQTVIEEDDYSNKTEYGIRDTYKKLENHINKLKGNNEKHTTDDELITIREDDDNIYNKDPNQNEPLRELEEQPEDMGWISSLIDD